MRRYDVIAQICDAMGQLVVDNLLSWAAGKPPLTPVAETPFRGRYRTLAG